MKFQRPLFQPRGEPRPAEINEKSKVGITILWGAVLITATLVGWGDRTLGKIDERLGHIEDNQLTIPMQQSWMLEFKNENPSVNVPPLSLPTQFRKQPASILDATATPGSIATAATHERIQ